MMRCAIWPRWSVQFDHTAPHRLVVVVVALKGRSTTLGARTAHRAAPPPPPSDIMTHGRPRRSPTYCPPPPPPPPPPPRACQTQSRPLPLTHQAAPPAPSPRADASTATATAARARASNYPGALSCAGRPATYRLLATAMAPLQQQQAGRPQMAATTLMVTVQAGTAMLHRSRHKAPPPLAALPWRMP